jgi:hypothetical protein
MAEFPRPSTKCARRLLSWTPRGFRPPRSSCSSQVRFRALCVIEALLRQGGGGGLVTVSEHFRAQPAAVVENLDSPQASVREKAKKVGTP